MMIDGRILRRLASLSLMLFIWIGPADADHDRQPAEDHPQGVGTEYLIDVIEKARYNPSLLNGDFFGLLDAEPHRSAARYAFSASLRFVDWYASPPARDYVYHHYPDVYDHFLINNTISVAVVSPDNGLLAAAVAGSPKFSLPEYAVLTGDTSEADIVLVIEELLFEPRVQARRKPKSKKYKKKYRSSHRPEERLLRAEYTKVEEKISVHYRYRISAMSGRITVANKDLKESASRTFAYGEDLRIITEAGVLQGEPRFYPSGKIQRRMETDPESTRDALLSQLRAHALARITYHMATMELPYRLHLPHERQAVGR